MRFPGVISMPNYFFVVTIGNRRSYFGGLRRLAPLDRNKRLSQRMVENIVCHTYRNDLKALLHIVRDFGEVLFVVLWNQNRLQSTSQSCQQLLLEAADRQNAAAQRDLAGHGDIFTHRDAGQHRHYGGDHGDTRGRTVLRSRAFRHVNVNVPLAEQIRPDSEDDRPRLDVAFGRLDRGGR